MNHKMFEKRCHYSIRKFAIGAASVMIGASLFGVQLAHAAETEAPTSEEMLQQLFPKQIKPLALPLLLKKLQNIQNHPVKQRMQPRLHLRWRLLQVQQILEMERLRLLLRSLP